MFYKSRSLCFFLLTFALFSCNKSVEQRNNTGNLVSNMPTPSEVWQVKAGSVYDGDTFRVVRDNKELKIRMCGIDAPEKKQTLGIESRDYLRSLLAKDSDRVSIVVADRDRYGRTVAEIFVTDGEKEIFVNGEMVRAGLAYEYKRYSGNCPNKEALDTAQKIAEASKVGVWSDPNRVYPWEYRKRSQNNKTKF